MKKLIILSLITVLICPFLNMTVANAADYTYGVNVSGQTATIWFKSNVSTTWVDVHYIVNTGSMQNYRMTYNSSAARYEQTLSVASGNVLNYFFTYNKGTPAYDTAWFTYLVGTSTSNSIYSIAVSSIPTPSVNGYVSVKVMNGTSGVYADNQIYWGVIGINPSTDQWCYLDLSGNLIPISTSLNDAPGHLTKNGINYANIYHKVSDAAWVTLPKIRSGRMFLSVGGPCYIKTYNDGFAGPDINNPTDPNRDIYFDFVEFTVDDTGYHGNTTRVDGFGFPLQHRLVNKSGSYDRTVGELESETRAGLFTKYVNEVPNEFKPLGTLLAPYRIVAPIYGSFKVGGTNANYFGGYSNYSTQDILLGTNGLRENPEICAALNRHVYTDTANWNNPGAYYKSAPANYYAKFWHDHSIDGLAYGFCYDDVNNQAAYLEVGDPKGLIIRVGW